MKPDAPERSCWSQKSQTRAVAAIVGGLLALGCLCACESSQSSPVQAAQGAQTPWSQYTTAELKERLERVHRQYTEVSREVELKSGLPMGVGIRDDRALLGDLYREAHEIERELVRRGEAKAVPEQRG